METIFLGMFIFGLGLLVLSFLLGFTDLHLPIPGAHDASFGLDHGDSGGLLDFSWLNISTVTAFITWFGGGGYLAMDTLQLPTFLALPVAAAGGILGAGLIGFLITRVLLPAQSPVMRAQDFRLEGTLARVTLPMAGSRIGEVTFTKGNSYRSEGARSSDGSPISRGEEVVILRYERGIAYVESLNRLLADGEHPRSVTQGSTGTTAQPQSAADGGPAADPENKASAAPPEVV